MHGMISMHFVVTKKSKNFGRSRANSHILSVFGLWIIVMMS